MNTHTTKVRDQVIKAIREFEIYAAHAFYPPEQSPNEVIEATRYLINRATEFLTLFERDLPGYVPSVGDTFEADYVDWYDDNKVAIEHVEGGEYLDIPF